MKTGVAPYSIPFSLLLLSSCNEILGEERTSLENRRNVAIGIAARFRAWTVGALLACRSLPLGRASKWPDHVVPCAQHRAERHELRRTNKRFSLIRQPHATRSNASQPRLICNNRWNETSTPIAFRRSVFGGPHPAVAEVSKQHATRMTCASF
jgi:hypothetical protein